MDGRLRAGVGGAHRPVRRPVASGTRTARATSPRARDGWGPDRLWKPGRHAARVAGGTRATRRPGGTAPPHGPSRAAPSHGAPAPGFAQGHRIACRRRVHADDAPRLINRHARTGVREGPQGRRVDRLLRDGAGDPTTRRAAGTRTRGGQPVAPLESRHDDGHSQGRRGVVACRRWLREWLLLCAARQTMTPRCGFTGAHRIARKRLARSGRRDSNPRHQAWKARALPTELLPRCRRSRLPKTTHPARPRATPRSGRAPRAGRRRP